MATYDDYEDYDEDEDFDFGSLPEWRQQEFLYEQIGFAGIPQDYTARELFWELMYNDELTLGERNDISDQLNDYLWNTYGIEFDAVWDWEDFRSWYETVSG